MKKIEKKVLLTVLTVIALFNEIYAASKKGYQIPEDEEIPQEELTTVVFKKYLQVKQIDDYGNPYFSDSNKKKFNKKLNEPFKERILYLKAGEHELSFRYFDGSSYADQITLKVNLEAGKSYDVIPIEEKGKVRRIIYDIQYSDTHESILPKSNFSLKEKLAIQYVQTVLQPVSEGKQIILHGNDPVKKMDINDYSKYVDKESNYIIEYGEDLTVTYTEKGKIQNGYIGFEATKAIIYIKFDENNSLTKEDFLNLPIKSCDLIFEIEDITSFGKMTSIEVSRTKPNKKGTITFLAISQ